MSFPLFMPRAKFKVFSACTASGENLYHKYDRTNWTSVLKGELEWTGKFVD